jgi:peptidyl-prolyl cis-trans isomerase SurA
LQKIKLISTFIIFFLGAVVFGQVEGDRIIAIIGNDIITESDFQYQVQLYARQNRLTEISPVLAQQIFQSMVTNKMILAKAEQDSIIVTEEEVNRELDSRIKSMIEQFGSQERLEQTYGMSIPKIKILLKEDLEKNLKIDKLKRKKFQGGIRVSEKEIQDFFNIYRDSLPNVSEEFEIAHIFLERKVSDEEKKEAKRIAELILDSIKHGVDFSELAKRNSGDSVSAANGGDLGYAKKGTFVKEFEEAVFSMSPGEVSEVVETQFGYHIIKLNEKQGDKVKSQHILIKFPKFESSDFETINFLKELKSRIEKGEITFDSAAKQYSQDVETSSKGGYLGKVPIEQLDSISAEILKNTSQGQITDPLRIGDDINYGYEIYKLINVYPPHKISMDEDYDRIKSYAEAYKENQEVEKWINEIRESIYVDIKM